MLTYHIMTEAEKAAVCDWRYAGEYALYNMPPYTEDKAKGRGFAAPDFIGFSFYDGENLIGFTTLYPEKTEVMLGIGVAPAYCGKGYGAEMIRSTCDLSTARYPKMPLYLEVRTWNKRAIRCYEKAGFAVDGEPFTQVTGLGEGTFCRMVLQRKAYIS